MKIRVLLTSILLLAFMVSSASSHETKTFGSISVLSHLEPLDNPAAGEAAEMYFAFDDVTKKFTIKDCDCRVTVLADGTVLQNTNITSDNFAPDWGAEVLRVPFVFPTIGIYQLKIEVKSKAGLYEPFELVFDKRIERASEDDSLVRGDPENERTAWYEDIFVITGGALVLGAILYWSFTRPTKSKQIKKKK